MDRDKAVDTAGSLVSMASADCRLVAGFWAETPERRALHESLVSRIADLIEDADRAPPAAKLDPVQLGEIVGGVLRGIGIRIEVQP